MGNDIAQPEQYTSNLPSKRGRSYRDEDFQGTTLDEYLRCSLYTSYLRSSFSKLASQWWFFLCYVTGALLYVAASECWPACTVGVL